MRVGVAGSSGLIGRSLVAALRARGDEVIPFVRPTTSTAPGTGLTWDPSSSRLNPADLEDARLDAVVNLAGAGIGDRRWNAGRRAEILNSRVRSTALLVQSLAQLSVKPFLLNASAIGFYGSQGDEVLDEGATRGRGFLAEVCEAWEREALRYQEVEGMVAIARTGIVLDRSGGALKRQLPLFRIGLGGRLGTGQQWVSPVSLFDEVRALQWILDNGQKGVFNICSPEPLRNTSLTALLSSALRRPAMAPVPAFVLRATLGSEMADELVLTSQRVLPRALLSAGFHFAHERPEDVISSALSLR